MESPKKPFWKRWYFIAGVLILFFVIGLSNLPPSQTVSQNVNTQNSESIPAPAIQPTPEEIIKVTANDLAAAYIANGVAADEKYKSKRISVSGTIKDIDKDIVDNPYIVINADPSDYITDIQCYFDKTQNSALSQLSKGQSVTLLCTGDGKIMNVMLKGCSIQ